jgi:uncharacterized membrane protein YhaH (DUF805 family)
MAGIYLHLNEAQHGPYSTAQLDAWLRDGTVAPETPAWQEGMAEWQPVTSLIPGAPAASRPGMPRRPQVYRPPGVQAAVEPMEFDGFNRVQYFGIGLLVNLLIWGGLTLMSFFIVESTASGTTNQGQLQNMFSLAGFAFLAGLLLSVGISTWLGVKRLQNIGWHGAWILLAFVPGLNVFMGIALVVLPPGFSRTRKLDAASWAWIVTVVAFIAFSMFIGMVALPAMRQKMEDRRQLMEQRGAQVPQQDRP